MLPLTPRPEYQEAPTGDFKMADPSLPEKKGETGVEPRRPRFLAAAVVLAVAGAATLLVAALTPAAREIGSGYVTYLVLAAAIELAAATGLHLRRRWGLLSWMSFLPLHQLIVLAVGTWSFYGFLIRLTVLVIAFRRIGELR
jgi:hypothetical protein